MIVNIRTVSMEKPPQADQVIDDVETVQFYPEGITYFGHTQKTFAVILLRKHGRQLRNKVIYIHDKDCLIEVIENKREQI